MQNYEIIIVGAGPAGASTALRLAALDPNLAERVLLLDKATLPRYKLCAGGVTGSAERILAQLGLNIDLRNELVHTSRFMLPTGTLTLQQEGHFRIIRRDEFDYMLFRAAQARGIVTRDGEAVEHVTFSSDRVVVRTSKNEYSSQLIIGADGANSTVRRLLGLTRASRVMVAIETFAPLTEVKLPDFSQHSAVFDFTVRTKGIPGYCWIFPAIHEDPLMVSLGVLESSFNSGRRISLKPAFDKWLAAAISTWCGSKLRAHPAIRYEPRAACSQYRALLVGDAAGIEPLFGEGITSALALGILAAECAHRAVCTHDFSFSDYERRINSSPIGHMMRRRRTVARRFYSEYPMGLGQLEFGNLLDWVTPMSPRATPATVTFLPSSWIPSELGKADEHVAAEFDKLRAARDAHVMSVIAEA